MTTRSMKLPDPPSRRIPSPMEGWYLEVLTRWWAKHKGPPTLRGLANLTKRSIPAVYSALRSLEQKGHVRRDERGKFGVIR